MHKHVHKYKPTPGDHIRECVEEDADTELASHEAAACTVKFDGHAIRFYHATKGKEARFEATCSDPEHQVWNPKTARKETRCRMTRHLSEANLERAASRPLGLMVAWLMNHVHFGDFKDHQDELFIRCITREQRVACRELLRKMVNGAFLLSCERKKKVGEEEEPLDAP